MAKKTQPKATKFAAPIDEGPVGRRGGGTPKKSVQPKRTKFASR